jgi:hypothetical protein
MVVPRATLVVFLLLALASARLFAAGHSGRVMFGEVPVPGAMVVASKGDRQQVTVTDEQGAFTLPDLEDGVWTIRIEMPAFASSTREIAVGPGTPPSVWTLTLKSLEELTAGQPVGAAPPITTPVATARAIPSRGPRPGPSAASPTPAAAKPSPAPTPEESPADAAAADGFVINGSVNNGAASPIAQSAAFGNNRRPGNSLYNGSLAFVYGGSGLDSRPFTFAGVPAIQPDYRNVKVIGTFGGPLKVFRTRRKDPTLFASFQQSDDHNATTQPGVVPTASERNGDFSRSRTSSGQPVQIVDPITGLPFPGNVIPAARISPQAAALLAYYPLPTIAAGDGFNFQAPLLTGTTRTLLTTRVTQPLRTNDLLTGLFAYQRSAVDQTTLFGFTDASGVSGIDTSLIWAHRVRQTLSLRVRYQFTRVTNHSTPYFANRVNVSGEAGITGNNQDPENWGPPTLQFSSLTGLSDALPAFTRTDNNSGGAEVYWTRGHHNLTFGGDARHVATDVRTQLNPRGAFAFTGALTGSDLGDFLLGIPSTSTIAYGNADKYLRGVASDAYVSDDWRFSPALTVQIGARWEFETPLTETQGRLVNVDITPGFGAMAPVLAGEVGPLTGRSYPDALVHADRSGVQPRVSMAWRPIPGSSLIVRSGYGIYRNTGFYEPIALLMAQQPPLSTAFTVSNSREYALTLANGFAVPASSAGNTFAVDPDLRVSTSQNWQVLVQRDVWGFLTLTGSYLGTKGGHLLQEFLPNTYPAGAVNPCPACPSGVVYLTSGGHSMRNAGQWQLRWRLHRGLAAGVQYTLAKGTDNATALANVNLAGSAIAQDWLNLDAEEARSNFDQLHQVVGQFQYTTGVGQGGGGLMSGNMGRVLSGWTIAGQLTTGTGFPLTPVYLAPVGGTGVTGSLRPTLTGASPAPAAGAYLNPDAYAAPLPGQWGNAGRNSGTGPAQFTFDLGVARAFQMSKRLSLDWRLDATNVLNRETYTGVNTIVGGPQFGLPNLANTPRRLLSTMRLRF